MAVVNIIAFFLCLFLLSYFWKESLVEVLPVLTCMLVLVLYVLAMLRHLSLIDGIASALTVFAVIWIISRKKEQKAAFGKFCLQSVTHPSFIAAMVLLLVVMLCSSGKVVTWWDDVNFWVTDVKSIYYLDGFAAKYGNVASGYGDYPPGGQLFKWWFLHWSPHEFREGLAFAGYYTMNLIFMLPLLRNLKSRNIFVILGMAAALWFLPSVAESYGYDGFCADLTMACIYGSFLFAVTDKEGKKESFYYGRLMLLSGVLVMIKSVGFIWAFFGLLFLGLYQRMDGQPEEKPGTDRDGGGEKRHKVKWWKPASVCIPPILTGGSWMTFCLLMRRVTNTTTTAVKYMTTDEYGISGYTSDYAKAFLKAFLTSPLHKEKSLAVDLTPLGFYLCICLVVIFFFRKNLLPKKQGKLVLGFSIISGLLFYGIIFIAHITIFATETQYLEASGMISSIERYGAPFTIGTMLFLADIWMTSGERLFDKVKTPWMKKYGTCLCFLAWIALTAGWKTGYHGLIGYRGEVAENLKERAEMIDEDAALFLQTLQVLGTENSTRVCYVQRDDVPRWVRNSYTNMEASPISVIYKSINLDDALTDWMAQEIRDTHASYLYVEETDANADAVFTPMMAVGEDGFACCVLYRIEDDGGKMSLVPVTAPHP